MVTNEMILEGRIDSERLTELRALCTAHWDQAFVQTEEGQAAADFVAFKRHDQTVRFIIPWLQLHCGLGKSKVVDFGAGCGSSALALSRVSREVRSYEIDARLGEAFRRRMDLFGADNVQLTQSGPEDIFQHAIGEIDPDTIVILVAVVEHLTETEQVLYLKEFWQKLSPGQFLVIVETPNYYSYFDTHTFKIPFAQFVPDAQFIGWFNRMPSSLRYRDGLVSDAKTYGEAAILEQRRRLGLGVTPEPFHQAFGCDLNSVVVADGFDAPMLNWFPVAFDDRLLLSAFGHHQVDLPIGFAKNVLSFIFRKPLNSNQADATRNWNVSRREEMIRTFGLGQH